MSPVLLAEIELIVEGAIKKYSDQVVESAVVALENAIKNKVAVEVLEHAKEKIEAAIKEQLLKLADKIDGKEG